MEKESVGLEIGCGERQERGPDGQESEWRSGCQIDGGVWGSSRMCRRPEVGGHSQKSMGVIYLRLIAVVI